MPKTISEWAVWGGAQVVLSLALRLAYKLLENSMIGWGDDRIAEYFGITSPSAETAFSWFVPIGMAALTLWLLWVYHRTQLSRANSGSTLTTRKTKVGPIIVGAAVVLAFIGAIIWVVEGHNSRKSTDRANVLSPKGPTTEVAVSAGASAAATVAKIDAFGGLSKLSNVELLELTLRFVKQIRTFESNYVAQHRSIRSDIAGKSDHEIAAQNQRNAIATSQLITKEELEFRNSYLVPAQQLREELGSRLSKIGVFEDPRESRKIAFDGILAGPNPISDAANFLETQARRLP